MPANTRQLFLLIFILTAFTFSANFPTFAGRTTQKKGIWLFNSTSYLVQAEIDKRPEIICLPKLEFIEKIDPKALQKHLRSGIKRQKAIFHLYHDGLGRPTRKRGLIFAMDVYLMDIKMTYIGYLRALGYKFKISKTPAFEDSSFLRNVRSEGYIASSKERAKKSPKKKKTATVPDRITRSSGVVPTRGSGMGTIKTKWDVMPKGVLPPAIRKMKRKLREKLAKMKSAPFRMKKIKVDPVRWATGKMGTLHSNGMILGAKIEGQTVKVRVTPPAKTSWLTAKASKKLKGQPTEFILQRDIHGHEIVKNGAYLAADLYFVDLGETWEDWLLGHDLPAAPLPPAPVYATQPITLNIQVVKGVWQGLRARALGLVTFPEKRAKWLSKKELIRITPPRKRPQHFRAFWREIHRLAPRKEAVSISFLLCPDNKPYTELGQKRVNHVLFPKQQKTLGIFMERATITTNKQHHTKSANKK